MDKKDKKILIIDDKPVNIKMLVKTLQRHRYGNVETVCDARQAMAIFRICNPSLVLLDLNMPFLTGYDIIKLMQEEENVPPIIVLTADMNVAATRKAVLDAGANDIFFKPLVLANVMATIDRLLGS